MGTDRKLTKFFLIDARKHRRIYLSAFALMPIVAVLTASGPKLIQLAVDRGMGVGNLEYLTKMTLLYLMVVLLRLAIEPIQAIMIQTAGIRTLREMRISVVEHISRLGKATFDRYPIGVLVTRATSDVEAIGETLATNLMSIITDFITVIAIMGVLFYTDVKLGLITLILLPIITVIINWFRVRLRVLHLHLRTLNGRIAAHLNETVSMRHEILNFHLSPGAIRDFAGYNADFRHTAIRSISYDAGAFSVIEGLSYVSIGVVLLLVSQAWFMSTAMSIGGIVMYILYLQQLFTPFRQLGQRFTAIQATYAALEKINSIMSLPLPHDMGKNYPEHYNLELNNVRFSYVTDNEILKGISVDVPERHSVAIVGPTGSGKTTIIRMLTRQYEVDSGSITLGGKTLSSIAREDLKHVVVLVPQEPTIIDGSILENITLARKDITREKAIDICRKITAHDFISRLPNGYDTRLATGGTNLSMGQRQLIALARAFATEAKILIFDESTANIDTETELMIQDALSYVMTQATTIIIAHRLSTIRHVEQILVLRNGLVEERGTHEELLSQHGLYSQMYAMQSL
jgi:ATP-binding cassette subfamily B multidrug efflux pump